jgi:alpha-beta hydrolase superfamily lysophospholipase
MSRRWRPIAAGLGCAAALGVSAVSAPAVHAAPVCADADVPVSSLGMNYSIHGTLCAPAGKASGAVMVLVPGTTYTKQYWDVPIEPETYNFRQAMNRAGHATFALDRLGSGSSSIPPSIAVTGIAEADTLHGVVQALRTGRVGGHRFGTVVLGGHSLGSADALYEAAWHRDVDGLLLTGFSHNLHAPNVAVLFTPGVGMQPAMLDPAFRDDGYDPGYITTLPRGRKLLYGPDDVPPELQQWDEATKNVTSMTEVASAFLSATPVPALPVLSPVTDLPPSQAIEADVFLVNGEHDNIVCSPVVPNCESSSSLLSTERPYFPNARTLQASLIQGAGHDLSLSVHSPEYQQVVLDWIESTVLAG